MLKKLAGLLCIAALFSCHHPQKHIVKSSYIDSFLIHYTPGQFEKTIEGNLSFWKQRMDSLPDNFVNGPEYASALVSHFRFGGDINDLLKADSLYQQINISNQGKEPGILRTMAGLAIMMHRFPEADSFLVKAIKIEGRSIANAFLNFDIAFEQGRYPEAQKLLIALSTANEYGYSFRRAKYEHYDGSLDSAIACMKRAAEKAGGNIYLQQAALSNAADLYIHKGDLEKANELYLKSIVLNSSDLHSLTGLGWIALVHDQNDSLAEAIFQYVHLHTQAPDILLKLGQLEEARNDSAMQKKYADEFVARVSDPRYERMYSKYLVDLYTGILHEPGKAVSLSKQELGNRPTPQVFAWYAWSLFCNNEKDKAWVVYKGYVSGKPLEGPELYYMGKLMQGLGKNYNAQQFFEAAAKNKYDLSPAHQKDLEESLD